MNHKVKITITLENGRSLSGEVDSDLIEQLKVLHNSDAVSIAYKTTLEELYRLEMEARKANTENESLYKTIEDTLPKQEPLTPFEKASVNEFFMEQLEKNENEAKE